MLSLSHTPDHILQRLSVILSYPQNKFQICGPNYYHLYSLARIFFLFTKFLNFLSHTL